MFAQNFDDIESCTHKCCIQHIGSNHLFRACLILQTFKSAEAKGLWRFDG